MKKNVSLSLTLLVLVALVTSAPFFFLLSASLKSYAESNEVPPTLWPREMHWENYIHIFQFFPFARCLFNTLIIAGGTVLGTLVSTSIVAWGFARYPGRWNNLFFAILILTLMLPSQITAIPVFAMFVKMGFYNTYMPLILPAWLGFNAFNVFLLRQFFIKIPKDLLDAARIDGANEWQVFSIIALPLCRPILVTLAVLNLVWSWNNYFGPLVYLNDERLYPISIGLTYFSQASSQAAFGGTQWQLLMAGSLVTVLPIIILFFFAQRSFINSVMSSSLKE